MNGDVALPVRQVGVEEGSELEDFQGLDQVVMRLSPEPCLGMVVQVIKGVFDFDEDWAGLSEWVECLQQPETIVCAKQQTLLHQIEIPCAGFIGKPVFLAYSSCGYKVQGEHQKQQ